MQLFSSHTLAQRQSMVVSAQLQQAIHLLALGNSDLAAFIEQQSEENPFLELALPPRQPAETGLALPMSRASGDDDWDRIGSLAADPGPSLYAHVSAEIARLDLSPAERAAASVFLDALEPSGWLGQPLAALAMRTGLTEAEAEALLARLQGIEPAGIFARSLAECLRLQARDQGILTPRFAAILDHLPMLAQADLKGLCRVCGCTMDELRADLRLLRGLNPKPGAVYETFIPPQRAPDVIVTRGTDGWAVDLNRSTLPRVVIRADEARAMARSTPSAREKAGAYVGERLAVARWLQRAVDHRNQTILKVAAEIMRRQTAFLEQGAAHLKPMILREVADAVGVHESTVSRVTTGMLVQTPQGTLPLKRFFSTALAGAAGEDCGSAAAVRHRIRQLVQAEDPRHPLSDDEIARIISGEGTVLARRTVAKYRDMLSIGSSTQRRRQAALSGQA
jgi:RNA polymerase sigma-54 factor